MRFARYSLLACLAASLLGAPALLADPANLQPLAIGASAPDFKLPGTDGKEYQLADFAQAKLLVVVFTCNHCPTAQAYEERIARLHADFKDKGVALVAISPNDPEGLRLDELGYTDVSDSFEEMKLRAEEQKFAFPYLYDGRTQSTAQAYGALATPHVFIFDGERKLRYAGRFDDSDVKEVKSHDTLNAVEALLSGKPVPVEKTRPFGCSIKWSDKKADALASVGKWNAEPVALETISLEAVRDLKRNAGEKLLLVNLWATWCGPCVVELPELVDTNRMYRKRPFQMVTISLDDKDKKDAALKTLQENYVSATNFILDTDDRDAFAEALDPEWPGPVPYTLLIAPGGKVIYRKSGPIDALELRRAIVEVLGRTY